MKNLKHLVYRFSFLVLLLFVISCKKDTSLDRKNEDTFMVTFKFNGFTNQVSPLQSIGKGSTKLAAVANDQNYDEGYLYYWSFNNENLVPDIRYNPLFMPTISYANGNVPTSFVNSTYAFDNFIAGKALTFAGANDIIIKMPIKDVIQVRSLGFDVGSPSTGPKDFEIFFSLNKGDLYETLESNNQFGNTDVANQKNSFSYDLTEKNIQADELWIKIKPKAGIRGESSTFNENSGVLRMDNLHLIGIAPSTSVAISIDKLHYFLFNIDKPEVILADVSELNGSNLLEIAIPLGRYKVCFITNTSNAELLLPINPTLETFYISNIFSNANAEIFGYVGELNIEQDQTHQIEVQRLFSQVKIEFTDAFGL